MVSKTSNPRGGTISSGSRDPVGQGNYVVKQGDCIESIAFERGLFWKSVWDHQQNAELKRVRRNPNYLLPGDKVYVPDKQLKDEPCVTEKKHRFKRKGVPSKIHIIIERDGRPLANVPYVLSIDGALFSKKTTARGEIIQPIPPNARSGKLRLGEGNDVEEYDLFLGHMDPVDIMSGVQARLNHLGFEVGEPDGKVTTETIAALRAFQKIAGLQVTGEMDQATRDALEREHIT
jgi:hypothetical protein